MENISDKHNFIWALNMLKKGYKVRREHWSKNFFIKLHDDGKICEMNTNNALPLKYQTTQAKDWEIYENQIKEPLKITPIIINVPSNMEAITNFDDKFNLWRIDIKLKGGKNARTRTKKIRRKA